MTDLTEPTQAPAPGGATERAASTAAAAKDQAASVASSAATEAKAVASEAAAEAKDVLTDARQQLRSQAEEQSAKVAALVGDIGTQLRKMAAAGESGPAKDIVASVADQAEQMSQRLGRRRARPHPRAMPDGSLGTGRACSSPVPPWRASSPHGWPVPRTPDSLKQAATSSNGSSGRRRRRSRSRPERHGVAPRRRSSAMPATRRPADRGVVMSATVEPGPDARSNRTRRARPVARVSWSTA